MTFKTQLLADNAVFFNLGEFGESATLFPESGLPSTVVIVRSGPSQFVVADPGQGDSDTFIIQSSQYAQPSPADKIRDESGVEWIIQPGFSYDPIGKTWSIPVISNGRLKA